MSYFSVPEFFIPGALWYEKLAPEIGVD